MNTGSPASYTPSDDTPETNLLFSQYTTVEDLFIKLQEQERKLAYVRKVGLKLGMMKSADKPSPYLAHVWDETSDHARMFREWSRSIGWEDRVENLIKEVYAEKDRATRAENKLNQLLETHPCACDWLDEQLKQ